MSPLLRKPVPPAASSSDSSKRIPDFSPGTWVLLGLLVPGATCLLVIQLLKPDAAVWAMNGVLGGLLFSVVLGGVLLLATGLIGGDDESSAVATRLKQLGIASLALGMIALGLSYLWGGMHTTQVEGRVTLKFAEGDGKGYTHYLALGPVDTFETGDLVESSIPAYRAVKVGDTVRCSFTNPIYLDGALYRCEVQP